MIILCLMEVPLNEDFHLLCACTYDKEERFDKKVEALIKGVYNESGCSIRKIRLPLNYFPIPFEII